VPVDVVEDGVNTLTLEMLSGDGEAKIVFIDLAIA